MKPLVFQKKERIVTLSLHFCDTFSDSMGYNEIMKIQKSIRLDESLMQALEELAIQHRRTLSNLIEIMLDDYLFITETQDIKEHVWDRHTGELIPF